MKPHQMTPSDAQWDAIRSADEHLLINAGAGTGKTFTVVAKALYLMGVEIRGQTIERPLALRDIAAITYTNKAAAELKDKLRTELRRAGRRREAYQVDTARVGTIHSFCSDILSEFALRSGRAPRLALVGEADGKLMEADVVRDVLLAAVESGSVDGLSDLLSVRSIREVQAWMRQLLAHGDALHSMRAEPRSPELVLLRLAQQAHSALVARLDESGQMDYDRMIVWTRDLLRDDATVRKALQRRIRVLIIDECQDIDPVQREIAYLLADPRHARTDTTRLVLVGDPKQSIYRFRKADVTVWRTIERDLLDNHTGRVVTLGESRRSVAPVLAFVDDFVGTLLDSPGDESRGMQDYEVPYLPLAALRSKNGDDAGGHAGVELIAVPALDTGKACNAEITRRSEARAIAERVMELRASGVQWRDIAILLCGWGGVDCYMDALRAAGIPAYTLRAEGFWGCREVLDVTIALAAILDPHDDRLLYGFLRSPFVGLTDETLLRIALHTGNPVWSRIGDVILPDTAEQARLTAGVKLLQRFGRIRDRVTVARLVEQLLDETGYLLHLQLLGETRDGSANQRIANVRKLARIAGANPEVTIADFLRMVEQERELGIREGEAVLYGERDDVVTVTSVHSAKGLEWKCVFWADLIRSRAADNDRLVVNGARMALGEPDLKHTEQPASWQEVRDSIIAEELAETKRLWYVAATRARDLLVLSGVGLGTGARPNAPSTALRAQFPQLDEMPASVSYRGSDGASYSARVRYAAVVAEDVEESEGGIGVTADGAIDVDASPAHVEYVRPPEAVVVPPGRGRYSASAVMSFQRCERRYWLKRIAGLPEEKVRAASIDGEGKSIDAARYGTIIHDILERVDADSDVTTMVGIALGECGDDTSLIGGGEVADSTIREKLTEEIERTMGRPEYRELRDADGARRELAFTFIDGNACFDGRLDLVAPGADGYRILDVKTGMSAAGDPAAIAAKSAEYAMQRAIYTRAVETITGGPVGEFVFDFTGPGMQEVVRGEALMEASSGPAAELLESTLARVGGGARELTSDPSMCRWCGYLSSGWCAGASSAPASVRAGLKLL